MLLIFEIVKKINIFSFYYMFLFFIFTFEKELI